MSWLGQALCHYLLKTRMCSPKWFKTKYFGARNISLNCNQAGSMIRCRFSLGSDKSCWINTCTMYISKKNQSSCWSNGSSCILLHVYFLPLMGSFVKFCVLIISLKVSISSTLPPSLFMLVGDLMKLKSPRTN
jgi:hypothetical protein